MQVVKFKNKALVESEYYYLISGKGAHGNFKKPIQLIKELRKKYSSSCFEYLFLTLIIRQFKNIILMSPKSIQFWIKQIDRFYGDRFYQLTYDQIEKKWKTGQTDFGKELSKALAYENLQKKVLKSFYHKYGIRTCYYCNSQYTLSFLKDDKEALNYQLDHIFPKKKYPYFSISMYNLIPACANCNLNKGAKDYWIQDYCHPYLESIGDKFEFTLSRETDKSLYAKGSDIDINDISIGMTQLAVKKVKAHNDMFDIQGIHGNFKEIAREIITLGREYPESKRMELLNNYKDDNSKKLFNSKESIDRVFLRVYPNKQNINERPLSKFIQDIARFSDFYDDK